MIDFDVLRFAFSVAWVCVSLYLLFGTIFGGMIMLSEFISSKLKDRKARDNDKL